MLPLANRAQESATSHRKACSPSFEDCQRLKNDALKLCAIGLTCVPLCKPRDAGSCTAPWHGIPCDHPGKIPLLKGYRQFAQVPPGLQWLERQFDRQQPCNAGLVVPAGSCVVEADSPDAEQEIRDLAGDVLLHTPARERRPGRGRGWLFSLRAEQTVNFATGRGSSKAIDFLPGGCIFVLPPSVHHTGHQLMWVAGESPFEVPMMLLPDALAALAGTPAKKAPSLTVPTTTVPGVSTRIQMLIDGGSYIRKLWLGEGKTHGDTSASGIDFALAVALLKARLPAMEVVAGLLVRPGTHRPTEEYCIRTVNSAQQHLRRTR